MHPFYHQYDDILSETGLLDLVKVKESISNSMRETRCDNDEIGEIVNALLSSIHFRIGEIFFRFYRSQTGDHNNNNTNLPSIDFDDKCVSLLFTRSMVVGVVAAAMTA